MRKLFDMDKKDYSQCTRTFTRHSARSIIVRDGKVAMVHSRKYDYYKFPGGGIENGENPMKAIFIEPGLAIKKNRNVKNSPYDRAMFEREAMVLELLIAEGMIEKGETT